MNAITLDFLQEIVIPNLFKVLFQGEYSYL
jgi:hypothetical protein